MSRSSIISILGCLALVGVISLPQISAGATDGQATETTKLSVREASFDEGVEVRGDVKLSPVAEEGMESPLVANMLEGAEPCEEEASCFACCCGPPGRFWIRGDYLLWWSKGTYLPPLATTSDQDDNGVLNRPTTEVLFGNQWINTGSRSNARLSGGFWLDCGQTTAITLDWFSLGRATTDFAATSDGDPLLARPFFDTLAEEQASELVSKSEIIRGSISGTANDYFQSGGVGLRLNLCCHQECGECGCGECGEEVSCETSCEVDSCGDCAAEMDCWRVDLVGGYRAFRLDEDVRVAEDLVVIFDPEIPAGTTYNIHDAFHTKNEFHGGEVGLVAQRYRGRWSWEVGGKVALGNNNRIVDITGDTLITPPPEVEDEPAYFDSGILALDSNTGRYVDDTFVAIPEINFEIGYQLTCNLRAYVGYNFLYWARVIHAADQINLDVNPSYFPGDEKEGDPAPTYPARKGDFWAHGLNLGLDFRY